jgi:hypothetical protein
MRLFDGKFWHRCVKPAAVVVLTTALTFALLVAVVGPQQMGDTLGSINRIAQVRVSQFAAATYYVDCSAGNDANSGTSASAAWKTLTKANAASLTAGGRLLLKRGCTFTGPLYAKWTGTADAPITIAAYSEGNVPLVKGHDAQGNVIKVTGSYQVLDGLQATANAPAADPNCQNQPVGWRIGFAFYGGAYNTVQNSKAFGLTAGVHLSGASHHNRVLSNALVDSKNMSVNTNNGGSDDSGGWGLLLNGDDNEIAGNSFSGNQTWCSYDFAGGEGASIEIYKAQRNHIHHNVSVQDKTFTELGGDSTKQPNGNTFAYNLFVNTRHASSEFLNLRGTGNRALNNVGYQTGSSSIALNAPGDTTTVIKNNIFWAGGQHRLCGRADPGVQQRVLVKR